MLALHCHFWLLAQVAEPLEVAPVEAEVAPVEAAPIAPAPIAPVHQVHQGPLYGMPATGPIMVPPGHDAATAREWSRLRARQRQGRRLAAGGFAGLGVAVIGNMVGGIGSGTLGEDPTTMVGLLPVAGPFVMAGWQDRDAHGWRTFFVLDGLAQVGFLAMGITGAVINKRAGRALRQPRFFAMYGRLEAKLDGDPDLVKRGRIGLGLGIGGLGGFGLVYLGSMMTMMSAESGKLVTSDTDVTRAWAAVPLAGPFVVAGQADLAGTKALMAILGVVQVGSLAAGITGVVMRVRRVRDAEARVLKNVSVAPWHSGMATGLAVRGQF